MDSRDVLLNQKINSKTKEGARQLRKNMTFAEQAFWNMVRNKRLAGFKFRRQQVIGRFVADFYCSTGNFVVEIDGSAHDNNKEADLERDLLFEAQGIKVLRLTNEEVLQTPNKAHQKVIMFSQEAPPRTART